MHLFEAILSANQRAISGDQTAGIHLGDYASELPIVVLTCVDPRLNRLFPDVMGLTKDTFIWLRNAGNIITGPITDTTRSMALACAVKGGREIVIIGHTDCQVCKTSVSQLVERFRALGVERNRLPENVTEYFGLFASERQNVIKAVEFVRRSPLISPTMPVQGLLVDTATGRLEWVVNGYDVLEREAKTAPPPLAMPQLGGAINNLAEQIGSAAGAIKFPDVKIGEVSTPVPAPVTAPPAPVTPKVPTAPVVPAKPATPPPVMQRPIPVPPPIRLTRKR